MSTFLVIIHTIVSIALILIILLQTGKGADMGAAFGGGSSQTLFGSSILLQTSHNAPDSVILPRRMKLCKPEGFQMVTIFCFNKFTY